TCVVTVTYGNRSSFLQKVVNGAFENGVDTVVIVDNGSAAESRKQIHLLEQLAEGRIIVVTLPENRGSAAGFKVGLEHVVTCSDCEYIWLLDDDNQPAEGALLELLKQHEQISRSTGSDALALVSLRENWELYSRAARGVRPNKLFPRKSSFLWFHLLD